MLRWTLRHRVGARKLPYGSAQSRVEGAERPLLVRPCCVHHGLSAKSMRVLNVETTCGAVRQKHLSRSHKTINKCIGPPSRVAGVKWPGAESLRWRNAKPDLESAVSNFCPRVLASALDANSSCLSNHSVKSSTESSCALRSFA